MFVPLGEVIIMIQIKLLKKTSLGKRGDVVYITRNEAHTLIDKGEGEIYKPKQPKTYKNRMLGGK